MINSMTGFGRAQSSEGKKYLITLELKSVNNRYLDINIRAPKFIISIEDKLRKIISQKINRGKVDVFINYKSYQGDNIVPKLDVKLAKKYYDCLKELENTLGITDDITVSKISKYPEVLTLEVQEENIEEIMLDLNPILNEAIDMLIAMRQREGEKLLEDITSKLIEIEKEVKSVEELAKLSPINYKKRLEDRIAELTGGMAIDEERVAQEVAIFADKVAVDEEFTRLYSHLNQIRKTLLLDEPIGRKLDFIIQEMNRETNTIGSKASDINIINIVINIKNLLEKIREQVQNIE
jgi:uncharacterized protein (TIGR00255 family)